MLWACMVMPSCSMGMSAETKQAMAAINLVSSKLDHPLFSGPEVIQTAALEGGLAVIVYPRPENDNGEIKTYYTFWVHQNEVYAVSRKATTSYPKLPKSPSTVTTATVTAALHEISGVTLGPEEKTSGQ